MKVHIHPWSTCIQKFEQLYSDIELGGEVEITPEKLVEFSENFDVMIKRYNGQHEHDQLSKKQKQKTAVIPESIWVHLDTRGKSFAQR